MANGYLSVPEYEPNEVEHRRKIARGANTALSGKLNAVTTITLTANAAQTTLTDARITPYSFIGFSPETANASAELGAGTLYVDSSHKLSGSAIMVHANNAQTDRTFRVLIIG